MFLAVSVVAAAQDRPLNQPPAGFTALFNGKDLSGWRGRKPNFDPAVERQFTKPELNALQTIWNADRDAHWKVDVAKGEIVSDGNNPHLATEQTYGDFELWVDWLMVSPNGDSGIYLRGYPQVQIWDPSNARELKNGADKGSGALWNNNPDNRRPVSAREGGQAHRPVEHPAHRHDRQSRVDLDERSADRGQPGHGQLLQPLAYPSWRDGPIELQTHGSEMRFRNIFIKEAPATSRRACALRHRFATRSICQWLE